MQKEFLISSVDLTYDNEFGPGQSWTVGRNEITKIILTDKPGEYCAIPYIQVWKGDFLFAETCQHKIACIYFNRPDATSTPKTNEELPLVEAPKPVISEPKVGETKVGEIDPRALDSLVEEVKGTTGFDITALNFEAKLEPEPDTGSFLAAQPFMQYRS